MIDEKTALAECSESGSAPARAMEEGEKKQTFKEKILFKITAFFVLLGTFSLFAFLFLVPFVIDPAFTTIFKQFDPVPVQCTTTETIKLRGTKNCTWSSCREGCTREVYNCTQIYVNYRLPLRVDVAFEEMEATSPGPSSDSLESSTLNEWSVRLANKVKPTHYEEEENGAPIEWSPDWIDRTSPHKLSRRELQPATPTATFESFPDSNSTFYGAKLYPNVKGCGYPPNVNCSVFFKTYQTVGSNYSCYYSLVDPFLVVSELDMRQVYLNLILSMAIPIPSFIISVIYLAFAYFVIYAEDLPEPCTEIPREGEVQEDQEEQAEKVTLAEDDVQEPENKTASLEEGLPDIDADDVDDDELFQADDIPEKQQSPSNDIPPPTAELIKPAAMMVVRPNSLQPSGPIAAV